MRQQIAGRNCEADALRDFCGDHRQTDQKTGRQRCPTTQYQQVHSQGQWYAVEASETT